MNPNFTTISIPLLSDEDAKKIAGNSALRVKVSGGVIGAATVLGYLSDEDVAQLDNYGLRGSDLWLAFKDFCNSDPHKLISSINSEESRSCIYRYIAEVELGIRRRFDLIGLK